MIRVTIASLATIFTLTLAGSAFADEPEGEGKHHFGSPGFIISADRLLPLLSYESAKTTQPDGGSRTASNLSVALSNSGPTYTFYNLPRLAFDWLPIQNLTVGGAFWFYTQLSASESLFPAGGGAAKSNDLPKVTYWGIAPRVGYVFPLTHMLSVWPRVGVGYQSASSSSVNGAPSQSQSQFAFGGDAMLVISPWNHLGFTVGPTIDVPISGKSSVMSTNAAGASTTTSVDSALFQFGISAGMLGHF